MSASLLHNFLNAFLRASRLPPESAATQNWADMSGYRFLGMQYKMHSDFWSE
jgi:hypothetical protein